MKSGTEVGAGKGLRQASATHSMSRQRMPADPLTALTQSGTRILQWSHVIDSSDVTLRAPAGTACSNSQMHRALGQMLGKVEGVSRFGLESQGTK